MSTLFPFSEYLWFYVLFTVIVLGLLAIDLFVFHKDSHEVGWKESLSWSVFWVMLALVFNGGLFYYCQWKFAIDERLLALPGFVPAEAAKTTSLEFLSGFLVEKALAVDNLFVFVVVFTAFGIPAQYQHRVLFFGILGALLFRVIFIALGSVLLQYQWIALFFGVLLIATGIKILFAPDKPMNPGENPLVRWITQRFRFVSDLHGDRFWIIREGRAYGTPLLLALIAIEVSDIIFAVDSVPAIFALTKEPLIVFTSNVFAILGMRSLYFLLAGAFSQFRYLKYGLGLILVFVGLKMTWLNEMMGGKFPVTWSLAIIGSILTLSILASVKIRPSRD